METAEGHENARNWVGFGASRVLIQALILVLTLLLASAASATTLNFESLDNGQRGGRSRPGNPGFVFDTPEATVTFSTRAGRGLAAFDTTRGGPNQNRPNGRPGPDRDLLVDSGIALIIQTNADGFGRRRNGNFVIPNDFAGGGVITSVFSGAVTLLSIDVIDINGNGPVHVVLTDGSRRTRTYTLPFEFTGDPSRGYPGIVTLDLTSLSPQVGVGPGTPSSTVVQKAGFDANDVRRLDYKLTGSGAFDNLTFVPEPSTALLVGLGLMALAGRRREA